MLQEKTMINDALAGEKSSLTFLANTIAECANPTLRATIQEIRNDCEASQYELYKLAHSKGYYKPATMADDTEIQEVKTQFQG